MNLYIDNYKLQLVTPDFYEDVMRRNDAGEIMQKLGLPDEKTLEQERLRWQGGMTMFNKSFHYFIIRTVVTEQVIGWCGYHTWYVWHHRAEIGYQIYDVNDRGKGVMKTIFKSVLQFGFEHMHLHRIEAMVASENIPSIRLLEGHGFEYEGCLREHYFVNNEPEDSLVYGLLIKQFHKQM